MDGEECGRNGCKGILEEKPQELEGCSCHLHPPCAYCVNKVGCCPICEWNTLDSLNTRVMLFEKYETIKKEKNKRRNTR